MRVAVLGCGGMLGRALLPALRSQGHDVVACPRTEIEVTDREAVRGRLTEIRPDAVVNLAAWTEVDAAEADEAGAARVNADGAGHVAVACVQIGARLLHLSTDYVLDGVHGVPLTEDAPVRPRSAYGRGKAEGERRVALAHPGALIVRTQGLYGRGGSNFPDTMLRLARGGSTLRVVDDQWGAPTWTEELAPALVSLLTAPVTGIVHLTAPGAATWYDVAVATLRFAGLQVPVQPISTLALSRPAPRPSWSVLSTERARSLGVPPLAAWDVALERYCRLEGGPP